MLHVEQLVLQTMNRPLLDDVEEEHSLELNLLQDGGWEGWHDEGGVLRSLFCLLMWDILFSPQADAFVSAYQDAPLDLYHPSFYTTR